MQFVFDRNLKMDTSQTTEQKTIPYLLQLLVNKEDMESKFHALQVRCDKLEFNISALNQSINFSKTDLRNFKVEALAKVEILESETTKLMDKSFLDQLEMSFYENTKEEKIPQGKEEIPGEQPGEFPGGEEKL